VAVKGQLPGVAKQSALFQDKLGHAKKPIQNMASYSKSRFYKHRCLVNEFPVWFAAMVLPFLLSNGLLANVDSTGSTPKG
jgi:hypothetical protein